MGDQTTALPPFSPLSLAGDVSLLRSTAFDRSIGPLEPVQNVRPSESLEASQTQTDAQLPTQQQTQPQKQDQQQQLQYHPDPRQLMPPLQQPQISSLPAHSQEVLSQHSFQAIEPVRSEAALSTSWPSTSRTSNSPTVESSHPYQSHQNYRHGIPPTSTSLTSALGHLAVPEKNRSVSRRWSLTGRFFGDRDRRKSSTEPFHVAQNKSNNQQLQPQQQQQRNVSANRSTNIVIVGAGAGSDSPGLASTKQRSGSGSSESSASSDDGVQSTSGKRLSPPSTDTYRKSSLADIPKAFLSSLRRASLTGSSDPPPSSTGNTRAMAAATAAVSASISAAMGTSPRRMDNLSGFDGVIRNDNGREYGAEFNGDDRGWSRGYPQVSIAVPRAPPQDAWTLARRPPPRSILKKRPSDLNANGVARNDGIVTSPAIAGAGARTGESSSGSAANASGDANMSITSVGSATLFAPSTTSTAKCSILDSESVHPMATPDMNADDIKSMTPTEHRAKLVTHSPTPNHPKQELVSPPISTASLSSLPAETASITPNNTANGDNSSCDKSDTQEHYTSVQGAAIPPDFTPGVQSNSWSRGGERAPGTIGHDREVSQAELLNEEMLTVGARAQELSRQYYGHSASGKGGGQLGSVQSHGQSHADCSKDGQKRRSINFLDKIEIIPAYRKADYNRQSDKNATFRVLTPDLKCEIRDELNTYKMREMAVHVDSMSNTAFH